MTIPTSHFRHRGVVQFIVQQPPVQLRFIPRLTLRSSRANRPLTDDELDCAPVAELLVDR
jgi:hypothetical protein